MIAPQLSPGTSILLLSPDHTDAGATAGDVAGAGPGATALYVPLIIAVMLTWVQIGDRITLIVAVVPLALVCALRICRGLVRREPLTSRWYECRSRRRPCRRAAWLAVRVISLGLAVTRATRGHSPCHREGNPGSTKPCAWGAGNVCVRSAPWYVAAAFAVVHLVGLALAGLGLAIWRFFRLDDLVVQVLAVEAIIINLAAFAFSTLPGKRVLFPDGRRGVASGRGPRRPGPPLSRRVVRLRLVPAGRDPGLLCRRCREQPAVPATDQALADWLITHHLTTESTAGANAITLETGALAPGHVLRVVRSTDAYQSKASRYDRRLHYANFVVSAMVDGRTQWSRIRFLAVADSRLVRHLSLP